MLDVMPIKLDKQTLLALSNGRVRPYFVCRTGGLPVQGVEALRAQRTLSLVGELFALERRLAAEGERISELLYEHVGQVSDRAHRNRLLQLRRDVFNLRLPPKRAADLELLPVALTAEIERLCEGQSRLKWMRGELDRQYHADTRDVRRRFVAAIQDADFQKGLLLSSRSLFSSVAKYRPLEEKPQSRIDQIERGLLRYLSRTAMKATPFGTFCAVIAGRFVPASRPPTATADLLHFRGDPRSKRSFVRLNKALYGILLEHLKTRPPVRLRLAVELNPTMREEGGRLVFLTAVGRREIFQRVGRNAVLGHVRAALSEGSNVPLASLIAALCADPQIDATPEEVSDYLDKLLEIGLLRFRTGIREQDPDWDLAFRKLLAGIVDQHAQVTTSLLQRARSHLEAYAAASVPERALLLQDLEGLVETALRATEIEPPPRHGLLLYEDASADAALEVALSPEEPAVRDLVEYTGLLLRCAWPRNEQATMRHFFDRFYGSEVDRVPLLRFYEDFYREHFKTHLEKEDRAWRGDGTALKDYDLSNPFRLEFIQRFQRAQRRLTDAMRQRWSASPDAEEIWISREDLEQALGEVDPPAAGCRSLSVFVQVVPPDSPGEVPRVVLPSGGFAPGYGKYFSRFLYMLPDELREQTYEDNNTLSVSLLAEVCGDAFFNANLHPPLLRWEISYPTGESGQAEAQLPFSEIYVERDANDPWNLILRHGRTGRRVIPVDLGFQNPRMRPPLYQLLSRFTPPASFALALPDLLRSIRQWPSDAPAGLVQPGNETRQQAGPVAMTFDRTGSPAEGAASRAHGILEGANPSSARLPTDPPPGIVYRPRLSYRGTVVLARRSWAVPSALFPKQLAAESAVEYFLRVQRWRCEHGIPQEVYVRIRAVNDPSRPGRAGEQVAPEPPAGEPGPEERVAEAAGEPALAGAGSEPATDVPGPAPSGGVTCEGESGPGSGRYTAMSRELHKPQYVDFANPLLVGLFGRMAMGLHSFVATLEERYPRSEQLPAHGLERYATELILQIDFPDAAAPARNPEGEAYVIAD